MAASSNGLTGGLPDRFYAVEIEAENGEKGFDAGQYSFFGDLSAADSGLEGALEDGLEAPPPEEGPLSLDYGLPVVEEEPSQLDPEEDLSVATIFRNQLGLGPKTPVKRAEPDEDAGLDALLSDPLSVARKQLKDDDDDQRDNGSALFAAHASAGGTAAAAEASSWLFGGSPAVLASQTAASAGPGHSSSGAYGLQSQQQSVGLFDGYADAMGDGLTAQQAGLLGAQQQPQPGAQSGAAGSSLLQMLKKPSQTPAGALTLEELEARMLSGANGAAAAGQPQPQPQPQHQLHGPGPMHMQGMPPPGHHMHPQQPHMPPGPYPHAPPPPPPGAHHPAGGLHPQLHQPLPPPHGHPGHMGPHPGPMGYGGVPPPPPGHPHHLHPHMGPGPMPGYGPMGPPGYPMGPPGHMGPPGPHPGQQQYPGMFGGNGPVPPHLPPGMGIGMMPHGGPMAVQMGGMGRPPGPAPHMGGPGAPAPGIGAQLLGPGAPMIHDANMGVRPQMGYPQRGPMGHGPGQPAPPPPAGPRPVAQGAMPQQQGQGHQPFGRPAPSGPLLGPGAAGLRPGPQQGRPSPDFGQQFARVGPAGALGASGPLALAAAATAGARPGGGGRLGGKWMRPEDVEYVVRSMLYSVASGVPYVEDYYYQAFVHRHVSQPSRQAVSPGAFPMAAPFVPEALRELSEDAMTLMRLEPSARAKFVEGLQGLGKIVLSNIRTPKLLMDLSDKGALRGAAQAEAGDVSKADQGKGLPAAPVRPLEQEPLLAARIMVEDCMNLLLDLDDVDRLAAHTAAMSQAQQRAAAVAAAMPLPSHAAAVAAAGAAAAAAGAPAIAPYGPSGAATPSLVQLRQRRQLLLAGINGAFRLPDHPRPATAGALIADVDMDGEGGAGGSVGDGVFLRIMALSKGRKLVARALLAIALPASMQPAKKTIGAKGQQQQQQKQAHASRPTTPAEQAASADNARPDAVAQEAAHVNGEGPQADAASSASASAQAAKDAPAAPTAQEEEDPDRIAGADAPSPYVLLWAALRNAWTLFGSSLQPGQLDPAAERPMLEATSVLAAAMREALLRLPTPADVVAAAGAFNSGCQVYLEQLSPAAAASPMDSALLPLAQTRTAEATHAGSDADRSQPVTTAPSAWLGEALAALVTRGSQLGLAAAAAEEQDGEVLESGSPEAGWRVEYGALHARIAKHLGTLASIQAMAAASGNAEALAVVRSLCCRQLLNALLPHASTAQTKQLRDAMQAFAA